MTDIMSPSERSRMMGRIRGADTKPELIVRRTAHRLGYRFRPHRRTLPGCPDLVFPGLRKIIFVHGCFWHRHAGCRFAYQPKTRPAFWQAKFKANVARDAAAITALNEQGWATLVLWECELGDRDTAWRNVPPVTLCEGT